MTEASRVQKLLNEQNAEIDRLKNRVEQLEAALREIAGARPECCCISDAMQGIARKALEEKDE